MAGDPIAAFYERFPYPWRDPDAGTRALEWIMPGSLPAIAHHVFGGVLPRGRPFRVLVAGGGTGDAVVSLGGWMKRLGVDGTIDYVDLSKASCEIARTRAEAAGITNVHFRIGRLEELADGPAGIYDYIDFCGVLNHVPDPVPALGALSHALASGGGMGVMAYGRLGRTGVYEAQAALGLLGVDAARPDGTALARAFVKGLPRTNWLLRNPGFENVASADEAELADVLLNPRDRAFDVGELDDLIAGAGLAIRTFTPPFLYDPVAAIRDPALKQAAAALDRRARWQLAELLQGSCRKHVFYAVKPSPGMSAVDLDEDPAERLLDDPHAVLVPAGVDLRAAAAALAERPEDRRALEVKVDGRPVSVGLRLGAIDLAIMGAIDGPTRVGDVLDRVSDGSGDVPDALRTLQRRLTRLGLLHVMAG